MSTPNGDSLERQELREALDRENGCPPLEELEFLTASVNPALSAVAHHVQSCPYCQTELRLLRRFRAGDLEESEKEPIRLITERLAARAAGINPARALPRTPESWWKALFAAPWPAAAAVTMAGILLVVAVGVPGERSSPATRPSAGSEVLRSNLLSILSPIGDLHDVPNEIRWQAVPGAARYDVQLLEVDRTELWRARTAEAHIVLPPPVRARIVPVNTLLCKVSALDASGHVIAQSSVVRFRLLR